MRLLKGMQDLPVDTYRSIRGMNIQDFHLSGDSVVIDLGCENITKMRLEFIYKDGKILVILRS